MWVVRQPRLASFSSIACFYLKVHFGRISADSCPLVLGFGFGRQGRGQRPAVCVPKAPVQSDRSGRGIGLVDIEVGSSCYPLAGVPGIPATGTYEKQNLFCNQSFHPVVLNYSFHPCHSRVFRGIHFCLGFRCWSSIAPHA